MRVYIQFGESIYPGQDDGKGKEAECRDAFAREFPGLGVFDGIA